MFYSSVVDSEVINDLYRGELDKQTNGAAPDDKKDGIKIIPHGRHGTHCDCGQRCSWKCSSKYSLILVNIIYLQQQCREGNDLCSSGRMVATFMPMYHVAMNFDPAYLLEDAFGLKERLSALRLLLLRITVSV